MGIPGNENADHYARTSLSLPNIISFAFSMSELRVRIRCFYFETWEQQWAAQPDSVKSFKPVLGPTAFTDASRPIQVSLTRVRLRTTLLTHGHHFKRTPRQKCLKCNSDFSLDHLFISCPCYAAERIPLQERCLALNIPFTLDTVITSDIPTHIWIQFLEATEILYKL